MVVRVQGHESILRLHHITQIFISPEISFCLLRNVLEGLIRLCLVLSHLLSRRTLALVDMIPRHGRGSLACLHGNSYIFAEPQTTTHSMLGRSDFVCTSIKLMFIFFFAERYDHLTVVRGGR